MMFERWLLSRRNGSSTGGSGGQPAPQRYRKRRRHPKPEAGKLQQVRTRSPRIPIHGKVSLRLPPLSRSHPKADTSSMQQHSLKEEVCHCAASPRTPDAGRTRAEPPHMCVIARTFAERSTSSVFRLFSGAPSHLQAMMQHRRGYPSLSAPHARRLQRRLVAFPRHHSLRHLRRCIESRARRRTSSFRDAVYVARYRPPSSHTHRSTPSWLMCA